MDGSDDYFLGDDIVLDEKAIAELDQAEQKWQIAQRTQNERPQRERVPQRRPIPQQAPLPIPKRQKTSHELNADGAAPFVRPGLVGEDYDEDLPDISIIGDGSYKLPAAQRASAIELAARIRGPLVNANGASTSSRPTAHAPARALAPPRALIPSSSHVPLRPPINAPRATAATTSTASGPSQSQGLGVTTRPPSKPQSKQQRLASIHAALADFVSPHSNPVPASTPAQRARSTRASPAPGPSRAGPGAQQSQASPLASSSGHFQAHKAVALPASLPRAGSGSSSSPVSNRRQSVGPPPSRQRIASPVPPQPPPPSQGNDDRSPRPELDAAKAQIEDLLRLQQETAKKLEEAQNARYAKEGEVSILRKSIEKTAKDHAVEVARIKAAREQAEAQQAQLRKEMNEELERMKTQYLFKNHELETSLRKSSPWVSRIKRTEHQGPLTPVSASTQRRQAAVHAQTDGPFDTPSRPRIRRELPDSPSRQRRKKIIHIPDSPPKKMAKLPGFYNAFEPSSQNQSTPRSNLRLALSQASQSTPSKKGKERVGIVFDDGPQGEDLFFNPPPDDDIHRPPSQLNSSPTEKVAEDKLVPETEEEVQPQSPGPPNERAEPIAAASNEDVEMEDEQKPPEIVEPAEPLLEPDWTKELHRIVLGHKHRAVKQPTLQLLLNHIIPSTFPDHAQMYMEHSTKLLETLGAATIKVIDTREIIHVVGEMLSGMGRILCSVHSIPQLGALLDMMKIIALFVPMFIPLTLAPNVTSKGADAPPEILLLLCETILNHLTPKDDGLDEHQNTLATETVGLLDVICWNVPAELTMRLSTIVRKAGVLCTLINPAQPEWLLQRTMRVLTLMASYRDLHRHFLSFPLAENDGEAKDIDYTRIPHIEKLASLLIDPARNEPGGRLLKQSILHFITTLAIAGNDALNILLQSKTLLPSIILFLMNISDPLWEEDEEFMASPELATWTVQMMIQVVVLLFHLFSHADSSVLNLRLKLMVAPKRVFNGLWHMFTVALGRISYAPPPDPISSENQVKLEQICDLAKDVLELAVDGPELESIWAAFHIDEIPSPKTEQDEESDSEARMLPSDPE